MPRNSPTGFVTAFFAVLTWFDLIWHIWWMVLIGLGAYDLRVFAWRDHDEVLIPAEEVAPPRSGEPCRANRGASAGHSVRERT